MVVCQVCSPRWHGPVSLPRVSRTVSSINLLPKTVVLPCDYGNTAVTESADTLRCPLRPSSFL